MPADSLNESDGHGKHCWGFIITSSKHGVRWRRSLTQNPFYLRCICMQTAQSTVITTAPVCAKPSRHTHSAHPPEHFHRKAAELLCHLPLYINHWMWLLAVRQFAQEKTEKSNHFLASFIHSLIPLFIDSLIQPFTYSKIISGVSTMCQLYPPFPLITGSVALSKSPDTSWFSASLKQEEQQRRERSGGKLGAWLSGLLRSCLAIIFMLPLSSSVSFPST